MKEVTFEEELKRIVNIAPDKLTPYEAGFLRARVSYLTDKQERKYADILARSTPPAKKDYK